MKLAAPEIHSTVELVPNYWLLSLKRSPLINEDEFAEAVAAAGLAEDALDEEGAMIPIVSEIAVVETLAERHADPVFALKLGQSTVLRRGSIVSYILYCSPTLRDGLANICEFARITRPRSSFDLVESGRGLEFRVAHPDPRVLSAYAYREFAVASMIQTLSHAAQADVLPREIHLPIPTGNRKALLERAFRCPLKDATAHTAIVLGDGALDRRIQASDEHLLEHLTQYGRLLLSQMKPAQESTSERVFQFLMRRIAGGPPRIGEAASALSMSERSLTRRLTEEGTTFRGVMDNVRFALSRALLDDDNLSLTEISYLLGYADLSAFTHAYKRWTGHAPTATRRTRTA